MAQLKVGASTGLVIVGARELVDGSLAITRLFVTRVW